PCDKRRQQRLTVSLFGTGTGAHDLGVLIRLSLAQPPEHIFGPDRPLSVIAIVVRAVHPAMRAEVLGDLDLERFLARCVRYCHRRHPAFRAVQRSNCPVTAAVISAARRSFARVMCSSALDMRVSMREISSSR